MSQPTDQLVTWLNSAYSMEKSLAQVLENHAKDAADFPDMQSRIQRHLEETRGHAGRIEECLRLLNEKPSTTKSLIGNAMGMVQGASTGPFKDELVKNALADFASEHFEIASYRSLIAGAEELGRNDIAEICRSNLKDEEAMAGWLGENIPELTRTFLQRQAVHA